MNEKKIRIAKIISHAGLCSRAEAEKIIENGKVTINNKPFFEYLISENQINQICVYGKPLRKVDLRVWFFYKPKGYVCSNREQSNQKSFFRILPKTMPRVVSVGRLDILSEGLLLLTNSPKFSNFMEKPSNVIERKYNVKVFGKFDPEIFSSLKKGITIKGIKYKGLFVNSLTSKKNNNFLNIRIYEGKNREIRKILSHFNLEVKILRRLAYGPFELANLKPGEIEEVNNYKLKKYLKKIKFHYESNIR